MVRPLLVLDKPQSLSREYLDQAEALLGVQQRARGIAGSIGDRVA